MTNKKVRAVRVWTPQIATESRKDGSVLVYQREPLGLYPDKITALLVKWAGKTPDRIWLAQRDSGGQWRKVSYGEALQKVRRIAQRFLDLGLSVERPLLILSDNEIEHALLAIAAQHVGIASAAISPAYCLVSTDHEKLADIARQLTPGLIYASDGKRFQAAIDAVFSPNIPVAVRTNPPAGRKTLLFADIAASEPAAAVDAAHEAITPDTIAKFLFTSGTTGSPKAVIQTHRMLCANQAMVADCYAFMAGEPPVVVDWAPWNHTASGNKVFNMVLYNGGTYYIDEGKPAPGAIAATIANLRDISPTWYFNVPAGYDMLAAAMEQDDKLRENFFRDLKMMMYAGAGLAQHTWDRLGELAEKTLGERVLLVSGLGATETGPFQLQSATFQERAGNIGIPARGVVLKLVPNEGKLEARVKSPSVTPGYWRNPELTAEAFDEEGFYKLGDALKFAVEGDASKGFVFDGRIAENFKLSTGTWVSVGALRAKLVNEFSGLIRDAAIAGENREYLTAIAFPDFAAMRNLGPELSNLADGDLLSHPLLRQHLASRLRDHVSRSTGSATRVARLIVARVPPSLDKGEITDKGSINQRAVLRHRGPSIDALYAEADPDVILPAARN